MRMAPVLVLLALSACNPPIDINNAPALILLAPASDAIVNEGTTLVVSAEVTDRDGDPVTLSVSSNVDGDLGSVEGTPGDTLSVSVPTLTWGEHTLTVTASDGRDAASAEVRIVVNGAPRAPGIAVTPEAPTSSDDVTITLTQDAVDPEGALLVYDYSWELQGSSGAVFDATLPATQTSKGQVWTATVDVSEADANGVVNPDGITVTATLDVTIGNTPPSGPTAVSILPSEPHPANDLRCVPAGATDVDGDTLDYTYEWSLNGSSSGLTGEYLSSSYTSPNDTWTCTAAPTDGTDSGPAAVSDPVVIGQKTMDVAGASIVLSGDATNQYFGRYALGVALDAVNGEDLAVGVPEYRTATETYPSGMVPLFRGGALTDGTIEARSATLRGNTATRFGGPITRVPDIFGGSGASDPLDELAAVAVGTSGIASPTVLVMPSGGIKSALPTWPFDGVLLQHASSSAGFGLALAGGDVDADGLGDVFVAEEGSGEPGTVYLFMGADIYDATASSSCQDKSNDCLATDSALVTIGGVLDGDGFGTTLATGDVDGDGASDLLVTAPDTTSGPFAWLFRGTIMDSPGALDTTSAIAELTWGSDQDAGRHALIVPDIDGDGYDEILVSVPDAVLGSDAVGFAGLILGGTDVVGSVSLVDGADVRIYGRSAGGRFGEKMAALGDLGHDGLPELAIAAPYEDVGTAADAGVVHLFSGADLTTSLGLTLTPDDAVLQLEGEAAGNRLTVGQTAGDLDNDGSIDLLVTSPYHGAANQGRVYVFLTGE